MAWQNLSVFERITSDQPDRHLLFFTGDDFHEIVLRVNGVFTPKVENFEVLNQGISDALNMMLASIEFKQ